MIHVKRQRGFLPLTGYAALAALVVIGGLVVAVKVQSSRLDAAKAELEACATRYETALASIKRQNEAVDALSEASQKRQKQAAAALAKARQGQGSLEAEIARLRSLKPADCAAGVAAVREGLRK